VSCSFGSLAVATAVALARGLDPHHDCETGFFSVGQLHLPLVIEKHRSVDPIFTTPSSSTNSRFCAAPLANKITLKIASGAAQNREFEVAADETSGLVVGPAGVAPCAPLLTRRDPNCADAGLLLRAGPSPLRQEAVIRNP